MKAIIRLTNLSNSTAVLKTLDEVINSDASLQKQIIENGVLFAELRPEEVKTLTEQLAEYQFTAYLKTENSVRLNTDGDSIAELIKILFMILGQEGDLAKILWARGLLLETLTDNQARDLKKRLEAEGAEVTLVDTSQFQFVVSGRVRRTNNTPFSGSGYTLQAFDQVENNNTVSLGAPVALQADGTYRISYTWESTEGRNGPNLLVRLLNPQNQIVAENSRKFASRQETLDLEIDVQDPLPEPEPEDKPFVVHGTIRLLDGSPLPGIMVRAFDRDMRSEEPLGEIVTDTRGFYEISYTRDQFQRAEKERADLLIRVMDANGNEIGVSETIFNAEPVQNLDLTLQPDQYRGLSEYERYVEELTPLIENVQIGELTDQDFSFLVGETGIAELHLIYLQQDARWHEQYRVDQAFYYGLFRQGISTNADELFTTPMPRISEALKRSIADNIIPDISTNINALLEHWENIAEEAAFSSEEDTSTEPRLGKLLQTSSLDPNRQRTAVRIALNIDDSEDTPWQERLKNAGFADDEIGEINFTLETTALIAGHLPTLAKIQMLRRDNDDLPAVRDLTKLESEQWRELIKDDNGNPQIPDAIPGDTEQQRVNNYVGQIETNLELRFPTAWIGHRVHKLHQGNAGLQTDLQGFFASNPDFDFEKNQVRQFIRKDADLSTVQDQAALQNALQVTQRLYRVADSSDQSRYQTIAALQAEGYKNATQIAAKHESTFVAELSPSLGIEGAIAAQRHAQDLAAAAGLTGAVLRDLINPYMPDALRPGIAPWIPADADDPGPPELVDIFGSLSMCACEHCESALSPAAYLTDLLNELSKSASEPDAAQLLFKRRPDIEHIKLNCANTDTQLPYIDLVNEVLEAAIASGPFEHQTTLEADELRARWEHRNEVAYNTIADTDQPWAPMFEPDHIQSRALLKHFGIDAEQWLERFSETDGSLAKAAAHLDISRRIVTAVTTPTSDNRGLGASNAKRFLQQIGLDYKQFLELREIPWVAGEDGELDIEFPADGSCDLNRANITGLTDVRADRIWRFLRLAKALDWSFSDLGLAMRVATHVSEEPNFETGSLAALVDLTRLAKKTNRSMAEAARLFAPAAEDEELARQHRLQVIAVEAGVAEPEVQAAASLIGISDEAATPAEALQLLREFDLLQQFGLTIGELNWLLKHQDQEPTLFSSDADQMTTVLNGLWEAAAVLREPTETDPAEPSPTDLLSEFLVNRLAAFLGADHEVLAAFIDDIMSSQEDWHSFLFESAGSFSELPAEIVATVSTHLMRLAKAARLTQVFGLKKSELFGAAQLLSFTSLPAVAGATPVSYENWRNLAQAVLIRDELPRWEIGLLQMIVTTDADILSNISGWPEAEIAMFMASGTGLGLDMGRAESYQVLELAMRWKRRLNISSGELLRLISALKSEDSDVELAELLITLGEASHGRAEWFEILTPINDKIREQKRDNLLAYLTNFPVLGRSQPFQDSDDVYAYFLIDPEMSSCRLTSRIKNAMSSVQLYVQRARMNLEAPDIKRQELGSAFNEEWKWRRNYRVWEANRRVFLYPENYIFPELRDNQTVFFQDFVNSLLQDEVNEDTVERATIAYLEKLRDVARLDMRAIHEDSETGEIHVLGRTYSEPHRYFYRKRTTNGSWQGWDPVAADVQGDHQVLVQQAGRLYLIWLTKIPYGDGGQVNLTFRPREVTEQWRLQLFWTEKTDSGWQPAKSSRQSDHLLFNISSEIYRDRTNNEITLKALERGNNLDIVVYRANTGLAVNSASPNFFAVGIFRFDACTSSFNLLKISSPNPLLPKVSSYPLDTFPSAGKFYEKDQYEPLVYLSGSLAPIAYDTPSGLVISDDTTLDKG